MIVSRAAELQGLERLLADLLADRGRAPGTGIGGWSEPPSKAGHDDWRIRP